MGKYDEQLAKALVGNGDRSEAESAFSVNHLGFDNSERLRKIRDNRQKRLTKSVQAQPKADVPEKIGARRSDAQRLEAEMGKILDKIKELSTQVEREPEKRKTATPADELKALKAQIEDLERENRTLRTMKGIKPRQA
jgi:Zn-dependent M16 (insulinase) family peptidase